MSKAHGRKPSRGEKTEKRLCSSEISPRWKQFPGVWYHNSSFADISPVPPGCLISLAGTAGTEQLGKGHQSSAGPENCFSHWGELRVNCARKRKMAASKKRWCKFHCTLGFNSILGDFCFRTERNLEI